MRTLQFLVGAVLLSGMAVPAAAEPDRLREGRTLRCESTDGRTRTCDVDARGGARLVRRLSRGACVEGESWGAMRDAIWVSHGCRGEFIAYPQSRRDAAKDRWNEPIAPGHVRCESEDGRWSHCRADTRGRVELARQLSRSRCVRGQSWGTDAAGVWVSRGCRADFAVTAGAGGRAATRFNCESRDGAPKRCASNAPGPVTLVRQLSRSPCIEGRTWGYERDAVWVADGCRAEFEAGGAWAGN